MLILFGSLIALVGFAFFLSRRIEYGEAQFGKQPERAIDTPVTPARRLEQDDNSKRITDDE
ncbi:hypothetical protein [Pelagerythrobacter sp.]|uniref:hypothetical protein n=1 Tax=Pelagerythrobacter sp. TaxID=2800702 RepID=UPI0035AEEB63